MIHKPLFQLQASIAIFVTVFAGSALAQQNSATAKQPAPATAQAQAPANTPYAIGAQRNGVNKCIPRINQVTGFLAGSNQNSGIVFNAPNPPEVNQKMVAAVMEVGAGNNFSFVSTTFSPTATPAECSATYDAITYWPTTCQQVAASNFSAFKAGKALLKSVQTLDGGPFVKVFLMPAGANGCVSVKKEIIF